MILNIGDLFVCSIALIHNPKGIVNYVKFSRGDPDVESTVIPELYFHSQLLFYSLYFRNLSLEVCLFFFF